jgi:hypothetical protein
MTETHAVPGYGPLGDESPTAEPASRVPFDLRSLAVTGLVIVCELDVPPAENLNPSMSMKLTQYLRLADESLIRLDMDRGVTTSRSRPAETVSWKRSASDVIAEVLSMVRADDAPLDMPEPDAFPWDAYAEAARLRGIPVDAEALRGLPHTVLLSDELTAIYEF